MNSPNEPTPPGTSSPALTQIPPMPPLPDSPKPPLQVSQKGIENAKKRLRAFSIQKKNPVTSVKVASPKAGSCSPSVMTGKAGGISKLTQKVGPKMTSMAEIEELKNPKPAKPGFTIDTSYLNLKKKTPVEIEEMKRKLELVELGIPLGLICPAANSPASKAMPTKAMPPIKSFLAPEQLDEIIREAKKAKAEGRVFKFDYSKLLPDYDNPFQNKKKEEEMAEKGKSEFNSKTWLREKWDAKAWKQKEREKDRDRGKDRRDQSKDRHGSRSKSDKTDKPKETDVNLSDYLICDSWSLDNDDKNDTNSPKGEVAKESNEITMEQIKDNILKRKQEIENNLLASNIARDATPTPIKEEKIKIEKLKPVMDSFTYEIDADDDDGILNMFEDSDTERERKNRKVIRREDTPDSKDSITDDFLESVINEIKQESTTEDPQDKVLVEYEASPDKLDSVSATPERAKSGSATPELVGKKRPSSRHSIQSDKSTEASSKTELSKKTKPTKSDNKESDRKSSSDVKTPDSGYKTSESYKSRDKSTDSVRSVDSLRSDVDNQRSRDVNELTLETWSFVMKICQPLLFRHDRNKCYKQTSVEPRLWFAECPKVCNCVKDRSIVYEELERCKTNLVDQLYGSDQVEESPAAVSKREWYLAQARWRGDRTGIELSTDWETEEPPAEPPLDPSLDREYQRFMESVWPEITEPAESTPPTELERKRKKKKRSDELMQERRAKRVKVTSQDWSQDSEVDEEEKSVKKKSDKVKLKSRKRKRSASSASDSSEGEAKKTKGKKKDNKKLKAKLNKRRRLEKKYLKKLKEKEKKKSKKIKTEKSEVESDVDMDKDKSKKSTKRKSRKVSKQKKRRVKKKRARSRRSTSTSSSSSSSDSDSEDKGKSTDVKKKKEKRKKKRKQSTSESTQSEDPHVFDVNILNNIKTEKPEEKPSNDADIQEFSPRRQQTKPRQEIINMKELQNDLVSKNMEIKKEDVCRDVSESPVSVVESVAGTVAVKSSEEKPPTPMMGQPIKSLADESKSSLSQESLSSSLRDKEQASFDHDISHLRPSSQNSNYSFHDVLNQRDPAEYQKSEYETSLNYSSSQNSSNGQDDYSNSLLDYANGQGDYANGQSDYANGDGDYKDGVYEKDCDSGQHEVKNNYEMYEEMAMEYQNNVATQGGQSPGAGAGGEGGGGGRAARRIETVVSRGEIKCDWRAGDQDEAAPPRAQRPSRWGLKPGEANIVLTGEEDSTTAHNGDQVFPIRSVLEDGATYPIERVSSDTGCGYDEAYQDTFGALDRLQYGDCFSPPAPAGSPVPARPAQRRSRLDVRISQVLTDTVLGEVANDDNKQDSEDKGILMKSANDGAVGSRPPKRVSFADGYKPGQDSDTEAPPKKKRSIKSGCAWPCPASHPDHVPLWDALPPPPPPPGSPPPRAPPPACLLPAHYTRTQHPPIVQHAFHKMEPMVSLPGLLADPPPGMMPIRPHMTL